MYPDRQWHSHLDLLGFPRCPPVYEYGAIIHFLYEKSADPFSGSAALYPSCVNPSKEAPRRRQPAIPEVAEAVLCEERKDPGVTAELIGAFEGKPAMEHRPGGDGA